jgi:hypothetical protein
MQFQHSCFISYRHHEQSMLAERFIEDFFQALRNELDVRLEEKIYLDRDRLKGGTFFNPALAGALCKSVCMLMIYTPTYFSRQHSYCAREYFAMENLERERLKGLPAGYARENGLIIPVVLRGKESLPPEIRSHRQFYNFEGFSLTSRALSKNRDYSKTVQEIADVVEKRSRMFSALGTDFTCGCDTFSFPTEDEVRPWIERMAPAAPAFPFQGR